MTAVIEIQGEEVLRRLQSLSGRLNDLTPIMRAVGETVRGHVDLNFRDSSDPYGAPWRPLSDVTLSRRRGSGGQPLRDTNRLANSVDVLAGRDNVSVGTNVEYAGTHQFGAAQGQYGRSSRNGPIPWGDIPARPFLPLEGLPADEEREVLDAVRIGLQEALRA